MYYEFFGLREAPFSLTPDTSFYYDVPAHRQALNTLLVALQMGEGFIKVTGEVGTGKTLLCRKLLRELSATGGFVTAYVPNPALTTSTLRYALADELGIKYTSDVSQYRLMLKIAKRLIDEYRQGRRVVLIIDEAQALSDDCLEAIRLLTNLETEKRKLLQVVLLGQPELDSHLAQPSIRQLRQRITFSYTLTPMDSHAVSGYVMHRLAVAGYDGPCVFPRGVARKLARACQGVPRLVNVIAHKCLLAAYGEGKTVVTHRHLRRAIDDTESIPTGELSARLKRVGVALAGTLSAGAVALGALVVSGHA